MSALVPIGNDVHTADVGLDRWNLWRAGRNPETGERGPIFVATIVEIHEDREYTISYPIPKPRPNSSGRRVYQHRGDLDSAIARVRKASRWSAEELAS